MGVLGGLLERIGLRRAPARPRPSMPAGPVVEPMPAPKPAKAEAPPAAKAPQAPVSDEERERQNALKELRRSFQHGILDARFREIEVDLRFIEDFKSLIDSGQGEFPVPPAAAFDVMRIVDDPGYPVTKVAAAIACDPALAGSVLSLANSPLHRGAQSVETLPDAIVRLGQRHLRLLLLEIALHSTRVTAKPYEAFTTLAWKHSLLTAQLAHVVAKSAGLDVDHAYMAGLFHDVGTFAVLTAARKLANRQTRRITAQTLLKLIDAHAHALDAHVVGLWRLPEPVAQAVIHRRSPRESNHDAKLAAVTAIANDLGRPVGAWVPRREIDFAKHPGIETLGLDVAKLPAESAILGIALKIEKVSGSS